MTENKDLINISAETKLGNTISLIYNQESGLVVVEFIRGDETGGFEILRTKYNETELLDFVNFTLEDLSEDK